MLYRQLPWIIGIAIFCASLALSAWQLYPLYQQMSGKAENPATPSTAVSKQTLANTPRKQLRQPEQYALFGEFNAAPIQVEQVENLPETKLRLTLTGVSASKDKSQARALIEGPDRSTESYRIDDTLPGNATLHSVFADRIVLSRGGKLETLYFPESKGGDRLLSTVMNEQEESPVMSADLDFARQYSPNAGDNPRSIPENLPSITPAQKQNIRDKLSALRARLKKQ